MSERPAPIIMLTGPSGAGKTTVGRLVAAAFDLGVHIRADHFTPFVVSGWVDPWLPEAAHQNEALGGAVVAAAIELAAGGYTVVLDGHFFPDALDGLPEWTESRGVAIHYAVLRPDLATCLSRVAQRQSSDADDPEGVAALHARFADLGEHEANVVDTRGTPDEVAAAVRAAVSSGRLRLNARPVKLQYSKDLYKGTAEYYDRFRPPYPAALMDDLRARVPLDQTSRILDLACGTGQIAFALAANVGEVWAVDQETESVEFGKEKARRLGVRNIEWTGATAEDLTLDGAFDLVAIGNAFHRLDRDVVARRLVPHLGERGCVALLWSGTPWLRDEPWQRAFNDTLERWTDTVHAHDRVPEGWEQAIDRDPHEEVLRRAGLSYEGLFEFSTVKQWSVESLIGFVYSTSFLNRTALNDQVDAFETDLRAQLLACCPDGVFEQDLTFAYELARRAG